MLENINVEIRGSGSVAWDDYVLRHPDSFFYHLWGWKEAFEDVFGFKTYYLEALKDARVCGIFPLVLVKTFFSKNLVSIPIGVYAGPISDDEKIEKKLIDKAKVLSREIGCGYLEVRGMKRLNYSDLPLKELYLTFQKELPSAKEECMLSLPRKARAAARQGSEFGLSWEVDLSYLEACYEIYAVNQKALGSPVVSFRWFKKLAEVFSKNINVLIVKRQEKCIAAVLTFFFKDTVLPFYGASLPDFNKFNPNNFMYLKLQEFAVEKKYKYFDFGRSRKDSGSYFFKINQGFIPRQLYYHYYLNKVKKIPQISPSNRCFDFVKAVWRHLPLSLTKKLGEAAFKFVMP